MTLKVRILPFLTTFTQLTARLKNFLRGWLLVLSLKEGLVECATVCVKSEVILLYMYRILLETFEASFSFLGNVDMAKNCNLQMWKKILSCNGKVCIFLKCQNSWTAKLCNCSFYWLIQLHLFLVIIIDIFQLIFGSKAGNTHFFNIFTYLSFYH